MEKSNNGCLVFFISLIIACLVYFLGGLIAWNIVCSIMDIGKKTIIELMNYRMMTYCAIACFSSILAICGNHGEDKEQDHLINLFSWIGGISLFVFMGVNSWWTTMWDSTQLILSIVFNLINVGLMTFSFMYFARNI